MPPSGAALITLSTVAQASEVNQGSPSLAGDGGRRLLHDQAKPLFDVRSALKNTLVARKGAGISPSVNATTSVHYWGRKAAPGWAQH